MLYIWIHVLILPGLFWQFYLSSFFPPAKAIDEYAALMSKEPNREATKVDPRLVTIVERMLDKYAFYICAFACTCAIVFNIYDCFSSLRLFRCILDGKIQQAIGISIECRRLDKLEEGVMKSDNIQATLFYTINISRTYVNLREYRHEVTFPISELQMLNLLH